MQQKMLRRSAAHHLVRYLSGMKAPHLVASVAWVWALGNGTWIREAARQLGDGAGIFTHDALHRMAERRQIKITELGLAVLGIRAVFKYYGVSDAHIRMP